jgi:predicted transcriptional regulator
METTKQVNPYRWAKENLSEPRARAFWKAYSELENARASEEYRSAYRQEEEIRIAFIRANLEKTNAIEAKARQEAGELEKQALELMSKAQELREQAHEETVKIQLKVYQTNDMKAQQAKTSELWRRDDEIFQPKVQALMDKYLKAQEASA